MLLHALRKRVYYILKEGYYNDFNNDNKIIELTRLICYIGSRHLNRCSTSGHVAEAVFVTISREIDVRFLNYYHFIFFYYLFKYVKTFYIHMVICDGSVVIYYI